MEMVSEAKELPRRRLIYGVLYLLLLIFPFKAGPYWTDVATFFGIYVLLGLAKYHRRRVGLFNMGHAAFPLEGLYYRHSQYCLGIPTIVLPVSGLVAGGFRLYPHQAHHSLAATICSSSPLG